MGGRSATYDGAGNQKAIGGYTFAYDAENRMTSSTINGGTATYVYDGSGHRAMKTIGGAATTYVYDAMDQLIAEYGNATAPDAGTKYISVDHLGSTRLVTDISGNAESCYDYLPFGEQIAGGTDGRTSNCIAGTATPLTSKFTGKEREGTEANFEDSFGFRYMNAFEGRFTSPDPDNYDARLGLTQSWNMYGYTINNPLKYTDNDGRFFNLVTAVVGGAVGAAVNVTSYAITQHLQGQSFDWGTAGGLALVGAGTGALAGFTFGGSLVANAVGGAIVGTAGSVINGAATRAIQGQDAFDESKVESDFESGFIGSAVGATVSSIGVGVSMGVKPAGPSPLGSVRSQLRHVAKLRAWQQARQALSDQWTRVGAVVGGLIGGAIGTTYNTPPNNGFSSVTLSWKSFWTFGCQCVPDVQSVIYY